MYEMELKEPVKKKRCMREVISTLPLEYSSKGELTKFHANLTPLGSCVTDPVAMKKIYEMGFFGKGSLSKSEPQFGRVRFGAPPVIRDRQYKRRQEWFDQVKKFSRETAFEDDKSTNGRSISEGEIKTDAKNSIDSSETHNSSIDSDIIDLDNENQDKPAVDIETLDNDMKDNQIHEESCEADTENDEVILDSTEEEDTSGTLDEHYQIYNQFMTNGEVWTMDNNFSKEHSELQGKLLVLEDSDSDTDENYLINCKPRIKNENFPVIETLHLTFAETFFLAYGLGCLNVIDLDGKILSLREFWDYLNKNPNFLHNYVTYHYFRSKGWIVKSGLKYGGDFLLYRGGPPYYHSLYIVIIEVLDAVSFKKIEEKSMINTSGNRLTGMLRTAESVGKEILFAQVMWPSTVPLNGAPASLSQFTVEEVLSQFTVREVLCRRWKLKQDTFSSNTKEDEDEEDGYSS
ncbi:hypothetical protein TKK_0005659 [Trichogramma kaykai]|uniref:tRNA-splicing endonuclease subunit Sen2 n=1 Tax=Trichogramma kaykai TaxID=54128 RepID=A0ABD2XGS0_9HYME